MRKLRIVLPVVLAVLCVLAFAGAALAVQSPTSDTPAPSAPTRSPLLIVELDAPPLAAMYKTQLHAASADGRLDVQSADAQAYVAQLQAEQAAFVSQLQTVLPAATVSQFIDENGMRQYSTYQVVFNGMAINPGANLSAVARQAALERIAKMPGVKGVYPDMPHYSDLYTSTVLINAPVVWDVLGGRAMAGAGVKFASMDGGVHHLSPMFNGEGYTYPNGFGPNGKGFINNNNGKIITSRAYFRSWDPPQTANPGESGCGDACAWPGPDGTPHGVHTASTAAGEVVTGVVYSGYPVGTISGVAPHAYVMSYKVFYGSVNNDGSFYTAEGLAALEDIATDGADVLNNSWGGGPSNNGYGDPIETALANTAASGVFISMSAGNDGPSNSTADHPRSEYINVAATTTSGTLASGKLGIAGDPALQNIAFSVGDFGAPLPIAQVITYPVLPSASVDPVNITGCDAWDPGAFTGKAALIERGACEFGVKVLNAEEAGAIFVIVYNHATGGNDLINMGPGEVGDQVTISSIFIGHTDGQAIADKYLTDPNEQAVLNTIAFQAGNTPDVVIGFSSRGPAVGPALVPDIAAPGVNILAQGYTPGASGEAVYWGYGQASGTSMAAPHVAGSAVLVRQAHPSWTNEQIKSALMSTAKYTDIFNYDGSPAQPLDMGAGRLDLTHVLEPGVILDPPKGSFGAVAEGESKTIAVRVTSVASQPDTYHLSTLYTGNGFTQTTALPGFTVTPTLVTLAPGESQVVSVTVDADTSQGIGENQGYVVMDGALFDAHMPVWARVIPAVPLADVLIIDNDASDLDPASFGNYLDVYTSTLTELGKSYAYVKTADNFGSDVTIPDAAFMAGFPVVLWYTGDNYVTIAGLTERDQYALLDYLNNGGTVIAMGQDLAATIDATTNTTFNWLYGWGLGAKWLQDSVSHEDAPNSYVTHAPTVPPAFRNVVVYLLQLYVDELAITSEDNGTGRTSTAVLNYGGPFNVANGTVAIAHRDQPLLEAPELSFAGKAFYTSFGLEGMAVGSDGVVTVTTPAELLGAVLTWAESEAGPASISNITPVTTTAITLFSAHYTATVSSAMQAAAVEPIAWRWDFGDGSPYISSATPEAGHTYICKENNVYTVRVQVTDSMGNSTIGSQDVDVTASCYQAPETIQNYFLPWIGKDK